MNNKLYVFVRYSRIFASILRARVSKSNKIIATWFMQQLLEKITWLIPSVITFTLFWPDANCVPESEMQFSDVWFSFWKNLNEGCSIHLCRSIVAPKIIKHHWDFIIDTKGIFRLRPTASWKCREPDCVPHWSSLVMPDYVPSREAR